VVIEGAAIGAPMMVEVKGHNRTPRQHSQRSLHRESDEDEEDRSLYTIKHWCTNCSPLIIFKIIIIHCGNILQIKSNKDLEDYLHSDRHNTMDSNKTDCHDIAEILLKVALNTNKQTKFSLSIVLCLSLCK
jgi:hypothetical protein